MHRRAPLPCWDTCEADIMDLTSCGLGVQGILCLSPSDQAAEAGIPRDHGHQQLGNHSANPLTATDARGTGTAGARVVSHALGSGSVRQPLGRA